MPKLIRTGAARRDVRDVLAYTRKQWGAAKYWEYRDLLRQALDEILADPSCGKPLTPAFQGILGYHIGKPGRKARHVVCYRVTSEGDVELVRFLYDGMDFGRHL